MCKYTKVRIYIQKYTKVCQSISKSFGKLKLHIIAHNWIKQNIKGHYCSLNYCLSKSSFFLSSLSIQMTIKITTNDFFCNIPVHKSTRKILEKYWESTGKVPGKYQESTKKVTGKYQEITRKVLGKWWESTRKVPGRYQESNRKVSGK